MTAPRDSKPNERVRSSPHEHDGDGSGDAAAPHELPADAPPVVRMIHDMLSGSGRELSDWKIFRRLGGVLLDTPEKAIDFAEAVVRARYCAEEVDGERPFVARDMGETWEVRGTNETYRLLRFLPGSSIVTLRKDTGEIVDYQTVTSMRAPPWPPRKDETP